MKSVKLALLVFFLVISISNPRINASCRRGVTLSPSEDLSVQEKIIRMESPAWRIAIAFTAASYIPDDKIREQFSVRRIIISKYASEPSEWGNYKDHFSKLDLVEAVWYNYQMFVYYLSVEDYSNATKFYGILAHYIGDASDPINSMNYTDNSTLKYAKAYEGALDNSSAEIFSIYSYAYTPNAKPTIDVNRTVRELIAKAEGVIDSVKRYVDEKDYEALSFLASELAEKALNSMISILLSAIQESGLADPWRFLRRWGELFATIFVVGTTVMFVLIVRNLRKRTVPEAKVEEETI